MVRRHKLLTVTNFHGVRNHEKTVNSFAREMSRRVRNNIDIAFSVITKAARLKWRFALLDEFLARSLQ